MLYNYQIVDHVEENNFVKIKDEIFSIDRDKLYITQLELDLDQDLKFLIFGVPRNLLIFINGAYIDSDIFDYFNPLYVTSKYLSGEITNKLQFIDKATSQPVTKFVCKRLYCLDINNLYDKLGAATISYPGNVSIDYVTLNVDHSNAHPKIYTYFLEQPTVLNEHLVRNVLNSIGVSFQSNSAPDILTQLLLESNDSVQRDTTQTEPDYLDNAEEILNDLINLLDENSDEEEDAYGFNADPE